MWVSGHSDFWKSTSFYFTLDAFSCYATAIALASAILVDRAFSESYDPLRSLSSSSMLSNTQESIIVPGPSSSQEELLYLIDQWPSITQESLISVPGPSTQDLLGQVPCGSKHDDADFDEYTSEMLERRRAIVAKKTEGDEFSLLVRHAFSNNSNGSITCHDAPQSFRVGPGIQEKPLPGMPVEHIESMPANTGGDL